MPNLRKNMKNQRSIKNYYVTKKKKENIKRRPSTKQNKGNMKGPKICITNEKWSRPIPPNFDPEKDVLIFQQHDIDHYNYAVMNKQKETNTDDMDIDDDTDTDDMDTDGTDIDDTNPGKMILPVIRMYGVTMEGYSVCCHVHGYLPYFYVSIPEICSPKKCTDLKNNLNRAFQEKRGFYYQKVENVIVNIELIESKSLMFYKGDELEKFARITVALPNFIMVVKKYLERQYTGSKYYESNIPFDTRFMVDTGIVGCCWIELLAGKWKLRTDPTSRCQIEVDVEWNKFIAHKPDGEWGKIAPLRILSFDIECTNRKGLSPNSYRDPVVQIANIAIRQGESEPFIRNVFTVNTCARILGSQVFSYNTEKEMLYKWSEFVREVDPDIITGHNINNFDFGYLMERAQRLRIQHFNFLGRIKNSRSKIKNSITRSNQTGQREVKIIDLEGRILFDLLNILVRDYKLISYALPAVCSNFLKESKEELHPTIITDLQNGSDQSRRRLAMYCLNNALLPIRLLNKLMSIINYMEMARVTGVSIKHLLFQGQQIKVFSQILRKAKQAGFLAPVIYESNKSTSYEGATIFEPNKGFYDTPITTLDFSSLYPSIMMAHNLCYTTLLSEESRENVNFTQTPYGSKFVKTSVRKGLLPEILESLLSARKKAKTELRNETDPFKRSVLDARQSALKMVGNSVYGFTGATSCSMPCIPISASVTAYGRKMIEQTKREIEKRYTRANKYEEDAAIIYGDTDSVMIKFGVDSLERSIELGRDAAEFVTKKFEHPIKLEFEKVYYPYLLFSKKKYAGMSYSSPDKYDKMEFKGIVRRNDTSMLKNLMHSCLKKILIDRDAMGAVNYTKQIISDLYENRIDISQLIMFKVMNTKENKDKQPMHVELAKKMKERDPGTMPKLGDRIPYVLVNYQTKNKTCLTAENPIYAMENNIQIDVNYYLKDQIHNHMVKIFQCIYGDKASSMLSEKQHTTTINRKIADTNPLYAFIVKKERCVRCKFILPDGRKGICNNCVCDKTKFLGEKLVKLKTLENNFSRLCMECQRCQGSIHQEILCNNSNCPIIYKRNKTKMELKAQQKSIENLTW